MNLEGVNIRPARDEDLEVLLEFEQGIIKAERPFDPAIKRNKTNYYDLPAMLASPDVRLLVAEIEGSVVGCGYARIEKAKAYFEHSHYAYLGFMYVMPEHRRKGINGRIIDALFDWALSRGVSVVQLEAFAANSAAIRAYEKAGFTANLVTMRARADRS